MGEAQYQKAYRSWDRDDKSHPGGGGDRLVDSSAANHHDDNEGVPPPIPRSAENPPKALANPARLTPWGETKALFGSKYCGKMK